VKEQQMSALTDEYPTHDEVLADIVTILTDMLSDWDGFDGRIGPDTRLVADLACSSVEIVEFAVTIEDHFDRPNLPFQELLMTPTGQYVDDLSVGELADFVSTALHELPPTREAAR
jgi:acyl carrier protein